MSRAAALDLPGWYLTAGCLFQTVWNVLTDRPPTHGIKDYDLFYFDDSDLSWEAEDKIIQADKTTFCEVAPTVEIRNEARVHLWYEHHFGVPCTPSTCTEAAIDSFAATTCCLGVRLEPQVTGASMRLTASRRLQSCRSTQSRTRSSPRL